MKNASTVTPNGEKRQVGQIRPQTLTQMTPVLLDLEIFLHDLGQAAGAKAGNEQALKMKRKIVRSGSENVFQRIAALESRGHFAQFGPQPPAGQFFADAPKSRRKRQTGLRQLPHAGRKLGGIGRAESDAREDRMQAFP